MKTNTLFDQFTPATLRYAQQRDYLHQFRQNISSKQKPFQYTSQDKRPQSQKSQGLRVIVKQKNKEKDFYFTNHKNICDQAEYKTYAAALAQKQQYHQQLHQKKMQQEKIRQQHAMLAQREQRILEFQQFRDYIQNYKESPLDTIDRKDKFVNGVIDKISIQKKEFVKQKLVDTHFILFQLDRFHKIAKTIK